MSATKGTALTPSRFFLLVLSNAFGVCHTKDTVGYDLPSTYDDTVLIHLYLYLFSGVPPKKRFFMSSLIYIRSNLSNSRLEFFRQYFSLRRLLFHFVYLRFDFLLLLSVYQTLQRRILYRGLLDRLKEFDQFLPFDVLYDLPLHGYGQSYLCLFSL